MLRRLILLLAAGASCASNEFGLSFLEENKPRDGVVTLASGLQYKVLKEGDGEAHPQKGTSCSCHYEGRTAQEWSMRPKGKTFDSSYARNEPTSFAPNQVIGGWTEAMQLMVEGDKWEMYIPSELGYGDSGQGADIGPGDVLVFTMEILKINGATVPAERGSAGFSEIAAADEFSAWTAAGGSGVLVLGVFRKPTIGDLFSSFKSVARKLAKSGEVSADVALYAQSRYDGKTKKYTVSELETQLGFKAPSILTSADRGKTWTKCDTRLSSADKIKASIAGCVRVAAGLGADGEL